MLVPLGGTCWELGVQEVALGAGDKVIAVKG